MDPRRMADSRRQEASAHVSSHEIIPEVRLRLSNRSMNVSMPTTIHFRRADRGHRLRNCTIRLAASLASSSTFVEIPNTAG